MSVITIKPELQFKANKQGLKLIYIRITQNKKHKRVNSGISILDKEWEGKSGSWINRKNPNHQAYNLNLQKQLTKYQNQYLNLMGENDDVNKEDIFKSVNKEKIKKNFLEYWDLQRNKEKNYNNYKGFDLTRKKIVAFEGTQLIEFKAINIEWLEQFRDYLLKNGCCNNYVYTILKPIRIIYNRAIIDKDLKLDKALYPFGKGCFKMPELQPTQLERLTTDELESLFAIKYEPNSLKYFSHLAFQLAFRCAGMRVEDLLTLKWSDIKNGRIHYNMKKGSCKGRPKNIEITKKIQTVLNKIRLGRDLYEDNVESEFILPFLKPGSERLVNERYKKAIGSKTTLYNNELKKIAKDAGIEVRLTSHIARHSAAAYAYEKTNDLLFVKEELGHKSSVITESYIGRLSTKQVDEKRRLIEM